VPGDHVICLRCFRLGTAHCADHGDGGAPVPQAVIDDLRRLFAERGVIAGMRLAVENRSSTGGGPILLEVAR